MTKEKLADLYFKNLSELKHWDVRYTTERSLLPWAEVKEDILKFIAQVDRDIEVYNMEKTDAETK